MLSRRIGLLLGLALFLQSVPAQRSVVILPELSLPEDSPVTTEQVMGLPTWFTDFAGGMTLEDFELFARVFRVLVKTFDGLDAQSDRFGLAVLRYTDTGIRLTQIC